MLGGRLVCAAMCGMLAGFAACGGSESSLAPLGVTPDAEAPDVAQGDAATEAITLDNVCQATAPKICALRKSCCDKSGGYDEATCLARTIEECGLDVAEARAGTMTFDPTNIDACFTKLGPLFDKCTLRIDDYSLAASLLKDCHAFAGKQGEGLPCRRDNQCVPSGSADAFTFCHEEKKVCQTTLLLGPGAICEIRDGMASLCGKGLYCDVALAGPPPRQGTCKAALAIGAACSQVKPLECGLGNYCDETNHCALGKSGGATCNDNIECATVACRRTGDGGLAQGTCKPQDPLVDKAECGK